MKDEDGNVMPDDDGDERHVPNVYQGQVGRSYLYFYTGRPNHSQQLMVASESSHESRVLVHVSTHGFFALS